MSVLLQQAMMMALSGGGGPTDPDFANVSSLLHFDGSFTDVKGKVWTPQAGATISTASPKFGSGCCDFTGSSADSWVQSASSSDFTVGTGAHTFEFWVRGAGTPTSGYLHDMGAGNAFALAIVGGRLAYYDPVTGTGSSLYTSGPLVSALFDGNWHHIAVSRDSGTIARAFFDGVQWGSDPDAFNNTGTTIWLGRYGGGGLTVAFQMDDYRFTKGVARYTANFTPPTASFPDS